MAYLALGSLNFAVCGLLLELGLDMQKAEAN